MVAGPIGNLGSNNNPKFWLKCTIQSLYLNNVNIFRVLGASSIGSVVDKFSIVMFF